MGEKIGFIIDSREVQANGMVKVSVLMLNSTKSQRGTNELPIILNSIKRSNVLDPETHVGFDYIFDFPLADGHGFPYVFDFPFEDEENRKLI